MPPRLAVPPEDVAPPVVLAGMEWTVSDEQPMAQAIPTTRMVTRMGCNVRMVSSVAGLAVVGEEMPAQGRC